MAKNIFAKARKLIKPEDGTIAYVITIDDWKEMRKERAGLPWYKNPSLKGTARL